MSDPAPHRHSAPDHKLHRSPRWVRLGGYLLVLATAAIFAGSAWILGRYGEQSQDQSTTFRVNGGSMVPTLWGAFDVGICRLCDLTWRVDPAASQEKPQALRCAHCGWQMTALGADAPTREAPIGGGDVVVAEPVASDSLVIGDLIAIRWDQRLHIKRIAALPGDRVEVVDSRVMVNGDRLEDRLQSCDTGLPRLLVDRDASRSSSRWSNISPVPTWHRSDDRAWVFQPPSNDDSHSESGWLLYAHQSVHDQNRASPVWDDYPFNVGLDRRLNRVDRLHLRGSVEIQGKATLEVAFWTKDAKLSSTIRVDDGMDFAVSCYDASPEERSPVDEKRPIAIRIKGPSATVWNLQLERSIEYRVRPRDDRDRYPLVVPSGRCFVLGDNVPVSVDSRELGLLPIKNILGRVKRRSRKSASDAIW